MKFSLLQSLIDGHRATVVCENGEESTGVPAPPRHDLDRQCLAEPCEMILGAAQEDGWQANWPCTLMPLAKATVGFAEIVQEDQARYVG